jgi:hypothetical protein
MNISPREWIEEYTADVECLRRKYPLEATPLHRERMKRLYEDWQNRLSTVEEATLDTAGRVDLRLFRNRLTYELRCLGIAEAAQDRIARYLTFAPKLVALIGAQQRMERPDPVATAETLDAAVNEIAELKKTVDHDAIDAFAAAAQVENLQKALAEWHWYFDGYDPEFTWWVASPYEAVNRAIMEYATFLREEIVGLAPGDTSAIVGRPVGRQALMDDLAYEMIPYTPEELIAVGEREFAWCENELRKASAELGYGDDWKAAQEHVKRLHVRPGEQTRVVRELALEAIEFLESRDLLTIPDLAKETWRMEMMAPERQKVNPFFLGGESIIVSYPTHTMTHQEKRMSMRGNNPHFSRATVQHELIPGHHMQFFMLARYKPYRAVFGTPFWIEGWALYWEMRLWDLDFPRGPEDRIGMLFWRMHRCARIIFSLKFHLGQMTADECIDMLVDRVGHERANAEGEVRRSFAGDYPSLYQAAYMIGGFQFRALHRELVESGRMTDREFHDAVLKENEMPVAILREILSGESPEGWKFLERGMAF